MCAKCVEAVRAYFPDCPEETMGDFLISATCFPFGDHEQVARQVKEHHDAGCKTSDEAMARADREMDRAMRDYHDEEALRRQIEPTTKARL